MNAELDACTVALIGEDGPQEAAQDDARPLRVLGAAVAEGIGQREDPLTDRHDGQDAVDQMGRGLGHAAAAAGGTEATALARPRDEPIVTAGIAVHAEESVGEYAALKIGPNLTFYEAGDRSPCIPRSGEKRKKLRTNDFMKERLLGLVTDVVGDGGTSAGTAPG